MRQRFQRWHRRVHGGFNARAVRTGDDHGRHALGVGRTVIFRNGGGRFGVADAASAALLLRHRQFARRRG